MSAYAANLFETVLEQYEDLQDKPAKPWFLAKRMDSLCGYRKSSYV